MKKLLFVVCFMLAGCAIPAYLSNSEAESTYGKLPLDYQEQVQFCIKDKLKDPDSAKFDFSQVSIKNEQNGYLVSLSVNAKNSYGGYAGKSMAWATIRHGGVVWCEVSSR